MLTYESSSNTTVALGDTNGDFVPDFGVVLNGDQTGFTGWAL